jgi:hypothetical protein
MTSRFPVFRIWFVPPFSKRCVLWPLQPFKSPENGKTVSRFGTTFTANALSRRKLTMRHVPPALEATQGHIDGFFSQLPYECNQNRHMWELDLRFSPGLSPGWNMSLICTNTSRIMTMICNGHAPNPLQIVDTISIGLLTENGVVMSTVLPTIGRRGPRHIFLQEPYGLPQAIP